MKLFQQLAFTEQDFRAQYLPRWFSFSSNATFNSGLLIFNCRAVEQPMTPPPTTTTSNSDVALKKQSPILTNKHGTNWKAQFLKLWKVHHFINWSYEKVFVCYLDLTNLPVAVEATPLFLERMLAQKSDGIRETVSKRKAIKFISNSNSDVLKQKKF